ncbi:hypothetical protein ACFLUH_02700 [Chloroflexota bacterium]
MMVTCELCGRQFINTQGLRGHKTFFHGQHAAHKNPIGFRDNGLNKSDDNSGEIAKEIKGITETIANLKVNLTHLQSRMSSFASSNEIRRIALEVDRLNYKVENHEQWLNPHGIDDVVFYLNGGPIVSMEKRLSDHLANSLSKK